MPTNHASQIVLRRYQEEAVNAISNSIEDREQSSMLRNVSIPTGGGKTLVAVKAAAHFSQQNPNSIVIFVAPEKELLAQMMHALETELGSADSFRKIGNFNGYPELQNLKDDLSGRMFFTTLHSWNRTDKSKYKPLKRRPLLIVIDEVHWGINAKMIKSVCKFARRNNRKSVPIIGFTATPRPPNHLDFVEIFKISFAELVHQGFLSRPVVIRVSTNFRWDPIFNDNGRLLASSLRHLDSKTRNAIIVVAVVNALSQSGRKGILFAIDTDHAKKLHQTFLERGISCSLIYGGQKSNNEMIAKFRSGESSLMIAVNMLTQGFDVPEITDVFLARPSESDVRLSQMIGRGSRLIPGVKESFQIYDFFDTVDSANANKIFHCSDLFSEPQLARPRSHNFPNRPNLLLLDESFGWLQGLEFIDNQTFGIELEITCKNGIPSFGETRWTYGANLLLEALRVAIGSEYVFQHGLPYHGSIRANATDYWRVESDSSAGWEVISPILIGREGLRQLIIVCKALEGLLNEHNDLFWINYRCGFHLTLATNLNTPRLRKRMLALVTRLEPGLFSLVAPSRRYFFDGRRYHLERFNDYCRPLTNDLNTIQHLVDHPRCIASRSDRYQTVNFCKCLGSTNLLEVRLHNGTVDFKKIVPWISLWMAIVLHATRATSDELGQSLVSQGITRPDDEDIFILLQREGLRLTNSLNERLFLRRINLSRSWSSANPAKYTQWVQADWYGDLDRLYHDEVA